MKSTELMDVVKNLELYEDIYLKMVDDDSSYLDFLNDAEEHTEDFKYRHGHEPYRDQRINFKLGAWRWKGMFHYRKEIADIVNNSRGADFGGAACPISESAIMVDMLERDIYGRKIPYNDIKNVDIRLDYIYTSHCLEHIPNFRPILKEFRRKLKPGGICIMHLPAYTCTRWLPENHRSSRYGKHQWSFYLASQENKNLSTKTRIPVDNVVSKFFNIIEAEYVGDNSIMIFAENTK